MKNYVEIPLYKKPRDEREAVGHWAPGNYFNSCVECKKVFQGSKSARQCAPCAYGDNQKEPPTKPVKPNQW